MAARTVAAATTIFCTKCTAAPPKPAAAVTRLSSTLLSAHNLPRSLSAAASRQLPPCLPSLSSTAIAAAVFSSLSTADAAFAAQQIADLAEMDSRGIALLTPLVPAIAWVLYNILQPALNQINRMRSVKGIAVGLVLGLGLGLASVPDASAGEVAAVSEAAAGDSRGLLLLVPVAVAIAWVLFNILQPALNQINKMKSG